jgi:hypothetical protein
MGWRRTDGVRVTHSSQSQSQKAGRPADSRHLFFYKVCTGSCRPATAKKKNKKKKLASWAGIAGQARNDEKDVRCRRCQTEQQQEQRQQQQGRRRQER